VLEKVAELWGQRLPEPTGETVLPGGNFEVPLETLSESLAADHSLTRPLSPSAARSLSRLYGTEAREVLALGEAPLCRGQDNGHGVFEGEIDWAIRAEGARHLEDVLYRRNRASLWAPTAAREVLGPAGRRMGVILGWDSATIEAEISAVRERMRSDLDFQPEE
jgi:glycerol-3-phosphate dehydrogenase